MTGSLHQPARRAALARLAAGVAAGTLSAPSSAESAPMTMQTRPISATGERLPVVGCGTYVGFDVTRDTAAYRELPGVLEALFSAGGSMIDSSPMYGRAEAVVGDLLAASQSHGRAFIATKVWTSAREKGIEQMEQSSKRLRARTIDLMQIHNLVDWRAHLPTLQGWKASGRIRYLGVTHYSASAYAELEQVMRDHSLDFVQLNYSVDDRQAETRLLPLAADLGIAVIVNMPFGGGAQLRRLRGRPLPAWAVDLGCETWAQALLKFVLGHPAVTCVIPGTGKAAHMRDNAAAGSGPMPDLAQRERIVADAA